MAIQTELQYVSYDSSTTGANVVNAAIKVFDDADPDDSTGYLELNFEAGKRHSFTGIITGAISQLATQAAVYNGAVKSSLSLPPLVAARDYYGADGVTVTKRVEFYV